MLSIAGFVALVIAYLVLEGSKILLSYSRKRHFAYAQAHKALDALDAWLGANPEEEIRFSPEGLKVLCQALRAYAYLRDVCPDVVDDGLTDTLLSLLDSEEGDPRPNLRLIIGGRK